MAKYEGVCQGAMTNAVELPSREEIAVPQELMVPAMVLRAGAFHLGKYCDRQWKEFVLCRNEEKDPRKCLKYGADLTACGVDFFRQVKQLCRPEFENYLYCVDCKAEERNSLQLCRKQQRPFDKCMLDKMNIERPRIGFFSTPRVHQSDRPKPPPIKYRDYQAEAKAYINELPEDYPIKDDYKRYQEGYSQTWY